VNKRKAVIVLSLPKLCGLWARGPRPRECAWKPDVVAHQTYCETWARGPVSLGALLRPPAARPRAQATDRARPVSSQSFGALTPGPRARVATGWARPTTSQQVWCATYPPPRTRPATGGLVPPRRNRLLSHQSFAVFGHEALDRVGAPGGLAFVAHQTYCETWARGPVSLGGSYRASHAHASRRVGSPHRVAKLWCANTRSPRASRRGGLAPPRRNRFGGLPVTTNH
jgi:hypothetical protein